MLALAVFVGVVESVMARLRLVVIPQMLVGAGALAAVALILGSEMNEMNLDLILMLVILTNLRLLASGRLGAAIRIVALQGVLVGPGAAADAGTCAGLARRAGWRWGAWR